MKRVYPVIFTQLSDGYAVHVPDWEIDTQGDDMAEAIAMARDAIGIMGIEFEDKGKELPVASDIKSLVLEEKDVASMVDIDFLLYRRANDRRTVRRNVSLPSWLNVEADRAGINVSSVLQSALKNELHISE